jgi:hypothetical protein
MPGRILDPLALNPETSFPSVHEDFFACPKGPDDVLFMRDADLDPGIPILTREIVPVFHELVPYPVDFVECVGRGEGRDVRIERPVEEEFVAWDDESAGIVDGDGTKGAGGVVGVVFYGDPGSATGFEVTVLAVDFDQLGEEIEVWFCGGSAY